MSLSRAWYRMRLAVSYYKMLYLIREITLAYGLKNGLNETQNSTPNAIQWHKSSGENWSVLLGLPCKGDWWLAF